MNILTLKTLLIAFYRRGILTTYKQRDMPKVKSKLISCIKQTQMFLFTHTFVCKELEIYPVWPWSLCGIYPISRLRHATVLFFVFQILFGLYGINNLLSTVSITFLEWYPCLVNNGGCLKSLCTPVSKYQWKIAWTLNIAFNKSQYSQYYFLIINLEYTGCPTTFQPS